MNTKENRAARPEPLTNDTRTRSPLEVLAAAAALTAVLLPATGVLMRWIGFALGGVQPSFESALAASTAQLTLSGFAAVTWWPIVVGLTFQIGFLWWHGVRHKNPLTWEDLRRFRRNDPQRFWILFLVWPLVGLIGSASTGIASPGKGAEGIGFAIAFTGTYASGLVVRWLSDRGRVTLVGAVFAVVTALAFAAIGGAAAGRIPGLTTVTVRFEPTSGLQDGSYVLIGHDGMTFLWSCTKNELEEVNSNVVIDVVPMTEPRIQLTRFSLGVHPACPHVGAK